MLSQNDCLLLATLCIIAMIIIVPTTFSRAYRAIDPPTKLTVVASYVLHGSMAFLVVAFVTLYVCYPLPPLEAYIPIAIAPIVWGGALGTINVKLMPQSYDEGMERLEHRLGH